MRSTFGDHKAEPGRLKLAESTRAAVREALTKMGYPFDFQRFTSGPINAIFFDRKHSTMWGGSSNHREDYDIAW